MVKSSIQKGTRVAQSATGDLMAEMFTLQEAERVQEEGFDDVNIYGGGRETPFLSREAFHVIVI